MKKLTTTQKKNRRHSNFCEGGPWNGKQLTLSTDGDGTTAVLKVGTWRGYYTGGISTHFIWHNTTGK